MILIPAQAGVHKRYLAREAAGASVDPACASAAIPVHGSTAWCARARALLAAGAWGELEETAQHCGIQHHQSFLAGPVRVHRIGV